MAEKKLGRNPRKFDMRIPRASLLRKKHDLPPAPLSIDYSAGLPDDLGEFLNDSLGDCTCAAYYHARQIWSGAGGRQMVTDSPVDALQLYEGACGYQPGNPDTDQGGVEQDVLNYLLNTGAPISGGVSKIIGYVEIDQHNFDDLKRTIADCGVAYIGIQVPQSLMDSADDNSVVWDCVGDGTIIGGHAIVLVGYDLDTFTCISWGKRYKITHSFLAKYLDEAYGILDHAWIESSGLTPFGMTPAEVETAMGALKDAD